MRRIFNSQVFFGSIFTLFFILTGIVNGNTGDQNKIQQLIEDTKQEITRQKRQEKSVLKNLIKQQQELNILENNYSQLNNKLSIAKNKINLTRAEQRKLMNSLGRLEKNLTGRQQLLNKRLVAAYKYGPQSYLAILLQADNFVDLIARFSTVSYFIKNDLDLIAMVEETKVQINLEQQKVQEKKQLVESELQKIVVLQNQVSKTQQKVASKVKVTKDTLSKIQTNRAQLEKALDEYEQTSREIETQIRNNAQTGSTEILGTGKMIWPSRGRLSSGFGWRYHPVLKQKKYHNGQDIAIPSGTAVLAADSGIVLVSGWKGGYGNFVAIDHGGGISTCYGHNSRLLVQKGERVYKGQQIAVSGNTGLSTGPHLHFEVRRNGVPVNPIPFLH